MLTVILWGLNGRWHKYYIAKIMHCRCCSVWTCSFNFGPVGGSSAETPYCHELLGPWICQRRSFPVLLPYREDHHCHCHSAWACSFNFRPVGVSSAETPHSHFETLILYDPGGWRAPQQQYLCATSTNWSKLRLCQHYRHQQKPLTVIVLGL